MALQQQLHGLSTRMEAAIQLNSSLESQLQLSPEELMLNTVLKYVPCSEQPMLKTAFQYQTYPCNSCLHVIIRNS